MDGTARDAQIGWPSTGISQFTSFQVTALNPFLPSIFFSACLDVVASGFQHSLSTSSVRKIVSGSSRPRPIILSGGTMDVPEILIVVGIVVLALEGLYNWKRHHDAHKPHHP